VLRCIFCSPDAVRRASTGYIAIHDDSVDGPRLGYLSSHKIVPDIKEAVEYMITTNGFMTEIMVAVSYARFLPVCTVVQVIETKNSTNIRMCVSTGLYGRDLGLGSKKYRPCIVEFLYA
jgi:hypothetical protein